MTFSGASVWRNIATGFTTGTGGTLTFNQEVYDTDDYHDLSVNPERLTIPTDGYYHVSQLFYPEGGYSHWQHCLLQKNGSTVMYNRQSRVHNPQSSKTTWLGECNAGDYFTWYFHNGTSGTITAPAGRQNQQASIMRLDPNAMRCKVKNTSNQYLADANTFYPINMQAEVYDPFSMHDTATNNSRINILEDGWYLVWGTAYITNYGVDTARRHIRFRLNGTTNFGGFCAGANGGGQFGQSADSYRWFNAGDYIEFMARDSGTEWVEGGNNYSAYFGVHKLI